MASTATKGMNELACNGSIETERSGLLVWQERDARLVRNEPKDNIDPIESPVATPASDGLQATSFTTDNELKKLRQERLESLQQLAELKEVARLGLSRQLLWKDLPASLQNDRETIVTALCSRKVSWCDLPDEWKEDRDIFCSMLESYQVPTNFIPVEVIDAVEEPVWSRLPYKLITDEKVIRLALGTRFGPQWSEVPAGFQSRPEIVFAAFLHNKIPFDQIPTSLKQNHREIALLAVQRGLLSTGACPCFNRDDIFLRKAIEIGKLHWNELPCHLKDDPVFARQISHKAPRKTFDNILSCQPDLCCDHSFWRHLMKIFEIKWKEQKERDRLESIQGKDEDYSFQSIVRQFASQIILSDRDLMVEMCGSCPAVFPLVIPELANDRTFLEDVLAQNARVLRFLDRESQLSNPDLVKMAITAIEKSPYDPWLIYHLADQLDPSFFMPVS